MEICLGKKSVNGKGGILNLRRGCHILTLRHIGKHTADNGLVIVRNILKNACKIIKNTRSALKSVYNVVKAGNFTLTAGHGAL